MSTDKSKLPIKKGNTLSMDDITNIISSDVILRAMRKVDLDYEPTDKEKLEEIMEHPELLARAVGMILTGKTDKEIAEVYDIKPFSVGFIRENEFVKALCEECFDSTIQNVKLGLADTANNSVASLRMLTDPNNKVSEKVRYMASMGVLNTLLKMGGQFKTDPSTVNNTLNVTTVQSSNAKEAYERALQDMQSIIPVADNIYDNTGGA